MTPEETKAINSINLICNSSECLSIISSGAAGYLSAQNLCTCNNAFTFFRTSGIHINFFTDTMDIIRHITMPETLSNGYEKKVQHVFSPWAMKLANGNLITRDLNYSPIDKGASSGLGALAYLVNCHNYDKIHMIGYTINESENNIWHDILPYYTREEIQPFLFRFLKK
jgi:hypothetical protein